MPLPWVRLDANIGTHDKILSLVADPSPKRWQALASYMISLGWSGGHDTDGLVRTATIAFVHGTKETARLLVKHGLWEECADGWVIHNYADRQQTTATTAARVEAQSAYGQKGNCIRWHGEECWKPGSGCSQKLNPTRSPIRAVK